jgi:type I restriction enzyme S subunit
MIVRAKGSVVVPEFLPFFMQSDVFMDRAEHISVGSLSPTINWKHLAVEEFALPPLEEQRRIAEALGASAQCREYLYRAQERLQKLKQSTEVELIAQPLGLSAGSLNLKESRPAHGWMVCNGQELLDRGFLLVLQDGNHGSQYPRSSELGDEGLPYIAASDISDEGDINLGSCRRIRHERAAQLRIPPARSGDVILTNNATVGRVTRLPEWPTDIVASTSTTYYRCCREVLDPDYLRWFFESSVFQFQLATIMRQSTRNQVPITTQKRLLFAVPQPERQKALAAQRATFLSARGALRDQIARISQLQKTLLEANL